MLNLYQQNSAKWLFAVKFESALNLFFRFLLRKNEAHNFVTLRTLSLTYGGFEKRELDFVMILIGILSKHLKKSFSKNFYARQGVSFAIMGEKLYYKQYQKQNLS